MARNMIIRMGVDASDFSKKMQQVSASAASTGKRIKKELNLNGLGAEVSKIMGWSGSTTGIGSINSGNVDLARSQLGVLCSYRDQLAGAGFDDYQFGEVSERIKALEYDLNEYTQSLNEAADAERKTTQEADQMGTEAGRSESFVSRISRSLRSIGSSGRQLSSIPGHFRRIGDSAGSSDLSISKMVRSIRNISLVSASVRIAEAAFGRLRSIVSGYISENAELQAQVDGLKSSMGQALAPAINIVTNAFSYLMPYVVGVSNAIGQLMSLLFGSGWTAATNGAKQTAAATGGAAKAQKEMNRQLMSFDEINKLSADNDSSGGGGGGAGSAFTPVVGETPAWAEHLKNTFTELFNSAEFQAENFGGKIGMVLNTAIGEASSALANVDFSGIGERIAVNFNSMIGNIDWNTAGRLVGQILTALPSTLVGFIQNADWASLGQSFSQLVSSALWTASEWISSVDWLQLGKTLKTFFTNIDYASLAQSLGSALGSALGAIGATLWGMIQEPWNDFVDTWMKNTEEAGGNIVAGLLESLAQGIANIGEWLKVNFCDPLINGVKDAFGIHSPSTVFREIGDNLMLGMADGVDSGSSSVTERLGALQDNVWSIADNLKSAFSFEWRMPQLRLPHLSVSWDPVDNVLAQFFGVTAFPRLSVSWFAKGGILDGAQIFGRMGSTLLGGGEAGREAILPLDTNTEWMDVLANRITQSLSVDAGGDVNATINLILDGEVITRVVVKGLRKMSRAGGGMSW